MKTINITAIIILGFVLISDEKKNIDAPEVCIPIVEPTVKIEKEVAVVENEPTADSFSRPRKPCPPSGPGRR